MFFLDFDKEFWVRDKQILASFRTLSLSVTLRAQFQKEGRMFKRPTNRWYYLIDNYLLYSEVVFSYHVGEDDISKAKGVVDLTFTFVEFEGGFIFTRNIHRLHLSVPSLFEQCMWEEKLRGVCILRNFTKDFTLGEKIGHGKFSDVFRCIKIKDQEVYAVKIFSRKLIFQKDALNSFKNEVRCLRNLNDNKRTLQLKYVYEEEQIFYLVTEHLPSGELKYKENESPQVLQSLMRNLLTGLSFIHERGIMHRDIKPANIVLRSAPDDAVIIDFGLATFYDQKTHTVLKCGTPGQINLYIKRFVAPEVLNHIEGKKVYNQKCDVYSMGITFYILLYGFNPFQDSEKYASIKKNFEGQIHFPKSPTVPVLAQNLLSQMLHKFPKERISAQQALNHPFFQDALESSQTTPNKQMQQLTDNITKLMQTLQIPEKSSQKLCEVKKSPRSYMDGQYKVYASCDGQFKSQIPKKHLNIQVQVSQPETEDPQITDWPIPDPEQPQKCEQFIIKVRANTLRQKPSFQSQ